MRDQLTEAVGKPHLSYSSLKYALGDMKLWEMYMRGQLKKESEALYFGSLYDMLLFEPDKAHEIYYTLDDATSSRRLVVSLHVTPRSIVSGRRRRWTPWIRLTRCW